MGVLCAGRTAIQRRLLFIGVFQHDHELLLITPVWIEQALFLALGLHMWHSVLHLSHLLYSHGPSLLLYV